MTYARSSLFVSLCALLVACASDPTPVAPPAAKVVTEHQLADDPERQVSLDELLILWLEDPRDESTYLDTGEVGIDIVPYRIDQATTLTLDAEGFGGLAFRIRLADAEGYLIAQTETGVPAETVTLEPGSYKLVFEHLYMYNPDLPSDIQKPETIFVRPQQSSPAAQWELAVAADEASVLKLQATRRCLNCNLRGAILTRTNLNEANLSGADLSYADMGRADLSWAILRGADLSYADMSGADLSWADMSGADLSWADMSGANLRGAALKGANLEGASWTDGRVCGPGSIGECLF